MSDFSKEVDYLQNNLDKEALKYVHFGSVKNFIFHLENIRNEIDEHKIRRLLENYFAEVQGQDGLITEDLSKELYQNYISKIGNDYRKQAGFTIALRLSAFFIPICIDSILLTTGILKKIYYVPIFTLLLLFSYLDQIFRIEKLHRLYGYRY